MKKYRVEKIPVVRKDGTLSGIYTLKDDQLRNEFPNAAKDKQGRLLVAGAIGVKESDVERAHELVAAGVDFLVLDVAHGALRSVETMLNWLKGHENITTPIIAGNVSTEDTTHFLIESGADGVKIGVGPGLVCDTRDVAGTGMPQITAIMQAREAIEKSRSPVPLMGDGGLRKPGDVPKAIGAGADSVMIGSLFAGTPESPGEIVTVEGHQQKMVRGMASSGARQKQQKIEGSEEVEDRMPEGNTKFVPVQGSVRERLFQLEAGLRSGMSYTGAFTIEEMKQRAQFVEVSPAGANEQRRQLR